MALLRGIGPMNPNMRNDKLRGVFEGMGFSNVATVISSGNVVFDSRARNVAALEGRIEAAWPAQLGFTSTTIIRSRGEIQAMIAADPFASHQDAKDASQQVTFLKRELDPPLVPVTSERGRYEIVAVDATAIYSVIDETGPPTALLRDLERTHGKSMTTRSWKSVHRIAKAMATT